MTQDQKKAVAVAIDYLRNTSEESSPADNWTEAEKQLFRRANPLTVEQERVAERLIRKGLDATINYAQEHVLGEKPSVFSSSEGCWRIIEDAVNRSGFFQSPLRRAWQFIIR
jgi:hypothetical protein